MKKFAAFILIFLVLTGISEAFIREDSVQGKRGLAFYGVRYDFDSFTFLIKSSIKYTCYYKFLNWE